MKITDEEIEKVWQAFQNSSAYQDRETGFAMHSDEPFLIPMGSALKFYSMAIAALNKGDYALADHMLSGILFVMLAGKVAIARKLEKEKKDNA